MFRVARAAVMASAIVAGRAVKSALIGLYEGVTTGGAKRATETIKDKAPKMGLRITREESIEIMDLEEDFSREELKEKYDKLMDANSDAKGGSFYLQSKVFRAHERLIQDMEDAKDEEGDDEVVAAEEIVEAEEINTEKAEEKVTGSEESSENKKKEQG
mmetsp:Transcript_33387/g.53831  ORF Transcript_33387/g.53831 Transcript_33387/m.53831 type:complete len:159 (+) Transcript_33387:57-533(+)|eukprot:jgi/Bigna1/87659/estExt_fgenesh1_pg.C_220196